MPQGIGTTLRLHGILERSHMSMPELSPKKRISPLEVQARSSYTRPGHDPSQRTWNTGAGDLPGRQLPLFRGGAECDPLRMDPAGRKNTLRPRARSRNLLFEPTPVEGGCARDGLSLFRRADEKIRGLVQSRRLARRLESCYCRRHHAKKFILREAFIPESTAWPFRRQARKGILST